METGNMEQAEIDGTVASVVEHANPPDKNLTEVATGPEENKPSIADIAAHDYMTLIPLFEKRMEDMSSRQIKKVISLLMRYPFEVTGIPKWSYPQEQELFNMGMKINDCKFVLMRTVLDMKKEEILALSKEQDIGSINLNKPEETKNESV